MRYLALLAAAALAGAANADVVYDNGAPDGVTGNEATQWMLADDFTLGTTTTLSTAGVYLAGYGDLGRWDGNLNWWIFDSSGEPGGVVASGSATPTAVDTGLGWSFGGNVWLVEFSLNDFTATAGTTYWLGVHAQDNDNWDRHEIYWASADANGTNPAHESELGTRDNWVAYGNEHAFYLTASDVPPGVPEPTVWALLIAGFGLVGTALRRRTLAAL